MYGMNLNKTGQKFFDEVDLMVPGLLYLRFEIKNYVPTQEEIEAEERVKEVEQYKRPKDKPNMTHISEERPFERHNDGAEEDVFSPQIVLPVINDGDL